MQARIHVRLLLHRKRLGVNGRTMACASIGTMDGFLNDALHIVMLNDGKSVWNRAATFLWGNWR